MFDKWSKTALLLDFYGNLLTDKQRLIMSYHYEEDMSLSEISEELNISRQAVHDIVRRSEKILAEYEEKLGLVQRFLLQKEKLERIKKILSREAANEDIKMVLRLIDDLIEM
ncbi:YlxM family DNA-binding protein [Fonticella tunisiensis]|uniref:UPF0122 protein EDD71_10686 n=1 Tax=Fonticella tunisiensis TaxID=1096341 RepID=A0A4R7KQX4_9CLOT|nr:YlxM family DNA-binding protein [Fonticella tunisiensis]TDT61602.1 hypothetical protein EDD71_10686 [Fonticella tunisiensis]